MPWFRKIGSDEPPKYIESEDRIQVLRSKPDRFEELDPEEVMRTTTVGEKREPIGLGEEMPAEELKKQISPLEAVGRGAAQGTSYGMTEEVEGGLRYLMSKLGLEPKRAAGRGVQAPLAGVSEYIEEARKPYKMATKAYPGLYTMGDIGSAAVPSPIPGLGLARTAKKAQTAEDIVQAANALRKAKLGTRMATGAKKAAKVGTIEGGLQALGRSEGDITTASGLGQRAIDTAKGVAAGGVGGAGLGASVPLAAEVVERTQAVPAKVTKWLSGLGGEPTAEAAAKRFLSTGAEGRAARALAEAGKRTGADVPGAKEAITRAVGPSPKEAAKEAIATRMENIKGYTGELGRQQREALQREFQQDVSEIVRYKDEILEFAHTGLKGGTADRALQKHLRAMTPENAIKAQGNAFAKADKVIDAVDSQMNKLIEAKGLIERSSGGQAKLVLDASQQIRNRVNASRVAGGAQDISSEAMSDVYIAIDELKRKVGKMAKKTGRDSYANERVKTLYEHMRRFLENPNVWGQELSEAQQEINKAWVKDLEVAPAVESAFMRSKGKRAITAADPFEKVTEAEGRIAEGFLADPKNPKYDADLRNLQNWLSSTEDLTKTLTKHYKDIPDLQVKVRRIQELREKVALQLKEAEKMAVAKREIGLTETQKAAKALAEKRGEVATKRALQEALAEEQASHEWDPRAVRRLQKAEEAYGEDVLSKLEEVGPEYRALYELGELQAAEKAVEPTIPRQILRAAVPSPSKAARHMRGVEKGLEHLIDVGTQVTAPQAATRGDIISQMWGDRPIETIESEPERKKKVEINALNQLSAGNKQKLVKVK